MLKEFAHLKQREEENFRRWFSDDYFDLIIWEDENGEITSFHLCYDVGHDEKVLVWSREHGYKHQGIDDGDVRGLAKMTPVMVNDGVFATDAIAAKFAEASAMIDSRISVFVSEKIRSYHPRQ